MYSNAVVERGGYLKNCVGSIDGTKIQIARAGRSNSSQRSMYSGQKRVQCLSYQTVTTPDGPIFHLHGPVEGKQPDTHLHRRSGIDAALQYNLILVNEQYCIYRMVYSLKPRLQRRFPDLMPHLNSFNSMYRWTVHVHVLSGAMAKLNGNSVFNVTAGNFKSAVFLLRLSPFVVYCFSISRFS